jgi:hypothetical protein
MRQFDDWGICFVSGYGHDPRRNGRLIEEPEWSQKVGRASGWLKKLSEICTGWIEIENERNTDSSQIQVALSKNRTKSRSPEDTVTLCVWISEQQ